MKGRAKPRFHVGTLRELAGDKVFARGRDYHRHGQVELLSVEPGRVLARVAGSDDYRTVLTGSGTTIDGECSCPAFEDWGFCKHMVAAALAANAVGANDAGAGEGALARIRRHLAAKGADALVEMIVDMAERDPVLWRNLDMAATAAGEDDRTLEAHFRKAVDDATRTGGYVDYREAFDWAASVEAVLDRVAELVPAGRAVLALRLIDRALSRIEEAIGEIDDSDGHCGGLLERAREIHLQACRAAKPDPVKLARDLFARETKGDYGTFHGAAALYADVLGEAGLAEYRKLAQAAWDRLPPLAAGRRVSDDVSDKRSRLVAILDVFAERAGDTETRIALRAKDLSSSWQYLELAEFCREHDRDEEALKWAEEGLWVFENERPDEKLVFLAVDLLLKAGRKKEAETRLWQAFERQPSMELYQRLRKIGGKAVRDRAVAALKTRLVKEKPTRWHFPADLLVRLLQSERLFAEAWATVRAHGASNGVKEALAATSEATHPREALAVYAARVEELAQAGGNPNYEAAHRLIARMAALHGTADQAAYVTDLKARFRRKRNFMKLLGA